MELAASYQPHHMRPVEPDVGVDLSRRFGYLTNRMRKEEQACAKNHQAWLARQYCFYRFFSVYVHPILGIRKSTNFYSEAAWQAVSPDPWIAAIIGRHAHHSTSVGRKIGQNDPVCDVSRKGSQIGGLGIEESLSDFLSSTFDFVNETSTHVKSVGRCVPMRQL